MFNVRLFLLLLLITVTSPAHAGCRSQEVEGKIFEDFDRIVIYYSYFTSQEDQQADNYPADLKYNNFTNLLTNAVQKNFAGCLGDTVGDQAAIMVAPDEIDEMFDPKTLTIVVHVSYVEPKTLKDNAYYGLVSYSLFRPGVPPRAVFAALKHNNVAIPIFPQRGEKFLRTQLDDFFRQIRPINYGTPGYLKDELDYWRRKNENGNDK